MKKICFLAYLMLTMTLSSAQDYSKEFTTLMAKGRSFYDSKEYENSGHTFFSAFRLQGIKPTINDRWLAACPWSLSNIPDSAFFQLYLISQTEGLTFDQVNDILLEGDFTSLHNDKRWDDVKEKMFQTAYKTYITALEDAVGVNVISTKNELEFIRGLGNHNDSTYLHLNDQAYELLRKKMFDKAFRYMNVSIDHFPWAWTLYKNIGDYYDATGDKNRAFVYNARALNVKYKYIPFEGKPLEKIDASILADYKQLSEVYDRTFFPPDYLVNLLANAAQRQNLIDLTYSLLKMNIDNYPNSFTTHRAMGDFFNKQGDKVKADAYNTRSWLLQYTLPDNFFDSSFNVPEYLATRVDNLSKQAGRKSLLPEPMINNIGNQFLNRKMFDKAELLFKMNVENYPQSRNALIRMSAFYKSIGNKSKEEEFSKQAQTIKPISGSQPFSGNVAMADTAYNTQVAKAICKVNCPVILIDEAHKNYHTSVGRYKPFADLMTNDGFKIIRGQTAFTKSLLQKVNVVVIASTLPIKSSEIKILNEWIREGGSLLAITDHDNPSSNELLQSLGVKTPDINYTIDSLHGGFGIIFSNADKSLRSHIILNGRDTSEKINVVKTFTGRTIIGPDGCSNLLPISESAVDYMTIEPNMRNPEYMIPIQVDGLRSHGVAFTFGKGKVVVVSEAAMLTAQLFPPDGRQVGMSVPGSDNKQFALNIMRWLAGYLK